MKKIFVDCGTHLFQGFNEFQKKYNINSSWYCYCFEANPITFEKSKDEYKKLIDIGYEISHYNKAVYNKNTKVKINCSLECGQSGTDPSLYTNQGSNILECPPSYDKDYGGIFEYTTNEIFVEAIDFSEFISKICNKDDFVLVKMDIEGSEFDVISSLIENNSYKLINDFYCEWHERFFENREKYLNLKNKYKYIFKEQKINLFDWI